MCISHNIGERANNYLKQSLTIVSNTFRSIDGFMICFMFETICLFTDMKSELANRETNEQMFENIRRVLYSNA